MKLETLAQRNPSLTVFIGDFNAKSKNWCSQDSTNFEGVTIENLTSQLVFAKFNLQIFYPSPYPREIWHYKQANSELIRRAISNFNWDRAFLNTNVNEKASIFTISYEYTKQLYSS